MPIYEYAALNPEQGCPYCANGFEVLARLSDPELTQCPQCGGPVRRILSAPAVAAGSSHLLKESYFSQRGFTQYKKIGGGVYEKTAGEGPRYISGQED
jgi:putative FmdB family regulatory protein